MAKHAPSFICQNCGAVYGRWAGKCEACGEWNCIADEGAAAHAYHAALSHGATDAAANPHAASADANPSAAYRHGDWLYQSANRFFA